MKMKNIKYRAEKKMLGTGESKFFSITIEINRKLDIVVSATITYFQYFARNFSYVQ